MFKKSFLGLGIVAACVGLADAQKADDIVGSVLLEEALTARTAAGSVVKDERRMVVIDYTKHSTQPRFFLVDLTDMTADTFLVAHGKGSDADHDGYADQFSNILNSRMSSLGAYVTGETYYGQHGLSLRLHGLDPSNDKALERYIVIHGADYVAPGRRVLGRSWGCPALEQAVAQKLIPELAGGTFIYAVGPGS